MEGNSMRIVRTCLSGLLVLALGFGTMAQADILTLNNGQVYQGKLIGQSDTTVRFGVANDILFFPVTQVKSLSMTPGNTTPSAAVPASAASASAPASTPAAPAAAAASSPAPTKSIIFPAGTALLIRMTQTLYTGNDGVGERFPAVTEADLKLNGVVVAPAGSKVFGTILTSHQANGIFGKSKMSITLNTIIINGVLNTIQTNTIEAESDNSGKRTLRRTGAGAAIGAAVGGGKGAAEGAIIAGAVGLLIGGRPSGFQTGDILEFNLTLPLTVQ
jgi:hypothetical protein